MGSELWDAREIRAARDYFSKLPVNVTEELGLNLRLSWQDVDLPPPQAAGNPFRLACHLIDEMHELAEGFAEDEGKCPQCNGFNQTINAEGLLEPCDGCDEDGKPIPIDDSERSYLARITENQRRWYHDAGWWRAKA